MATRDRGNESSRAHNRTTGVLLFALAVVIATSIDHVGRVFALIGEAAALKERAVKSI
jgi:hypothetical protein